MPVPSFLRAVPEPSEWAGGRNVAAGIFPSPASEKCFSVSVVGSGSDGAAVLLLSRFRLDLDSLTTGRRPYQCR